MKSRVQIVRNHARPIQLCWWQTPICAYMCNFNVLITFAQGTPPCLQTLIYTSRQLYIHVVHGSDKWLLLRLRFQHKRVLNHIGEIPLATLPYMAVA